MVGDNDITLGEVYRLVEGVRKDLREQNSKFIPVDLYISERDGLREDVKELNNALTEARAEIGVERNARLAAEQERDRDASSRRLQWTLVVASPIASILVTWFLTSAGLIHGATP